MIQLIIDFIYLNLIQKNKSGSSPDVSKIFETTDKISNMMSKSSNLSGFKL